MRFFINGCCYYNLLDLKKFPFVPRKGDIINFCHMDLDLDFELRDMADVEYYLKTDIDLVCSKVVIQRPTYDGLVVDIHLVS
tara:strand:- start:571 stop:816 length:246 start_codon:yes stop_codon:yes gene_type:complete